MQPINKVEDLKGLKMRTPGGYAAIALKALGMTPVSLSAEYQSTTCRSALSKSPGILMYHPQRPFLKISKAAAALVSLAH
jgi:hypothetical protein